MKPIRLNGLTILTPVALGPMAGVTDDVCREIASMFGCGLFYTEMVSAKALHYRNKNAETLLKRGKNASPVGVQLFGSDPDVIAEEALKIEDRFDFIDFNMGCPVPKIVKNHEGSYLLKEPKLAEEIFRKLARTVHKPVSVKLRSGFSEGSTEAVGIAKIAEASGVSMIAVHARTREQYYSGRADWSVIRSVREAVSIPVIGNGDVRSAYDAKRMMDETGCDGVMVARAAEGNPWLFREIREYLENGTLPERPSYDEIRKMILLHAEMLVESKGEHTAVLEMRKHASWYLQGMPNAAEKRRRLNEAATLRELEEIILEDKTERERS
ncbi:MAG: tRNA dihydrouridine synthase DusB [Lachnospiraceae bacterium]|nr:tRNA dihydrouridine synthase DusB [Lachnospiraceae bacterium]